MLGRRSPNAAGLLWLSLLLARHGLDPGRPVIRFIGSPELNLLPALPSTYLDAPPALQVNYKYAGFLAHGWPRAAAEPWVDGERNQSPPVMNQVS